MSRKIDPFPRPEARLSTPFFVWTTQRTGSTVFWRTLDAHPRVEAHGEMFLPEMTREDSYTSWLARSRWRGIERRGAPGRSVARYLAELCRGGPGVEVVGWKLMYNHLGPPLEAWIRRARPRVVHLVRRNRVKLLVSRIAAEQRGLYHLEPDGAPPADRVKLDPQTLPDRLARLERELARGREHAEAWNAVEVAYEELLADREATYRRVFDFLGVGDAPGPLPVPLRKINPDALPELVENWDDVKRVLRETRWQRDLE